MIIRKLLPGQSWLLTVALIFVGAVGGAVYGFTGGLNGYEIDSLSLKNLIIGLVVGLFVGTAGGYFLGLSKR